MNNIKKKTTKSMKNYQLMCIIKDKVLKRLNELLISKGSKKIYGQKKTR